MIQLIGQRLMQSTKYWRVNNDSNAPQPDRPRSVPAVGNHMRVFSSGGGVQSTAVLVLSAQGHADFPIHLFANTGDDSENPETLDYVRNISIPFADKNGIEFHELHWTMRDGRFQTLRERIYETKRSVPIPARMGHNGAPGNRACTYDYKIRVIDRWIAQHGGKGNRVVVGLGISVDEIQRAKFREEERVRGFMKTLNYPLIDLHISRSQCQRIIKDADLPIPPRSACYFCPYHSPAEWIRIRNNHPELFNEAVKIEKEIQRKRREVMGKDDMYLHPALVNLDRAVGKQMIFDDMENCESGYCMV